MKVQSRPFRFLILVALYILAAQLGFFLGSVNGQPTLIWPPTGLALAALLIFGLNLWPAVAVGGFLVNYWVSGLLLTAFIIAVGSTLEAIVAAHILKKILGFRNSLERRKDVFALIAIAALMSTAISTLIGISASWLAGSIKTQDLSSSILIWWLGEIIADLVIAPFLLVWSTGLTNLKRPYSWLEAASLIVILVTFSIPIFLKWPSLPFSDHIFPFMVIPVLILAAFRFGQHGTTTALLISYIFPIYAAKFHPASNPMGTITQILLDVHLYLAFLAPTLLILGATICERRNAESELKESYIDIENKIIERTHDLRQKEGQLELAQKISGVGSWERKFPLNRITWSKETYSIFGLESKTGDLYFDEYIKFIHPDDREKVIQTINKTIETRDLMQSEYRIIRSDGAVRTVQSQARIILDSNGKIVKLVGVIQDITEKKETEVEKARLLESERQARSLAEKANKAKDLFLATVSHELRTPLTTILSWAQLLKLKRNNPDLPLLFRGIEKIEESAQSQEHLIHDLLDLSRIMAGTFSLEKRLIDPVLVIKKAIDTIRPIANQNSIQLKASFTQDVDTISADPIRIQQMIWNLVSNSIKFTPKGGKVVVLVDHIGETLEIKVIDTGKGIRADFLPHLFEPFRQADASFTRKHGGLGLGLRIVKTMVDLHGGTVHAESAGEGRGATFTIRLPVTNILKGSAAFKLTEGEKVITGPALEKSRFRGLRILLVDDDPNSLESISLLLQMLGASVVTASSSAEAFDAVSKFNPHILISDIGMPGESGYTLLERLKERWQENHEKPVPAIALTAYTGTEDRRKALSIGFREHVSKPVDIDELIKTIVKVTA